MLSSESFNEAQFESYTDLVIKAEKLLDQEKYEEAMNIIKMISSELEENNTLDGILIKSLCIMNVNRSIIRNQIANIKKNKEILIQSYSDILFTLRKRADDFKKAERYDEYTRRISNIYSLRAVVFLYAAGMAVTPAEASNLNRGITDHVRGLKICAQSEIQDFHIKELNKVAKDFKLPLLPVDLTHAAIDQWHAEVQSKIVQLARHLDAKFRDKIESIGKSLTQKLEIKKIESVAISLDELYETATEAINNKQFESAIKDLIFLLQLFDKNKDKKYKTNKVEATLVLAYCYKMSHKFAESVKKYRSALDQLASMPDKKTYWHSFIWVIQLDCGLAYLHNDDFKNALKEFKNSIHSNVYFKIKESSNVNNPCQTLREIARALIGAAIKAILNKLYQDAVNYLTTLIDLNEKPKEKLNEILIFQLLAEAYGQLSQEPKAHFYLEKVIALDRSVGDSVKEKLHQIKVKNEEAKVHEGKKINITMEKIIKPEITVTPDYEKNKRNNLISVDEMKDQDEKRKRRLEIQKEKVINAARQKKEESERIRLQALAEMEEETKKKIAEVRRREAEKRAAKQVKKQQQNVNILPQPLSLKKSKLLKKMEERKQRELAKAERKKALFILKKTEIKPKIPKKPNIKKERITENRREVVGEVVAKKRIEHSFDRTKIERLIAKEASASKRLIVTKRNEEIKSIKVLEKNVVTTKNDYKKNILSEQLPIQDIALVMRADIGQIREIIQSNPLLRSLLILDQVIQSDPILRLYNIQLTFEGTSIFIFIMAYYQGMEIDFIVNDLDLFIYNMPYKTSPHPFFHLSADQQTANSANTRLEMILRSFGFVSYNSKKHFSNYKQESIAIELTVRHKHFKSTDPFNFTHGQAFFLKTGGFHFIDRNGYIRKIAKTNILDCDLITKDTPYLVKFFSRLLKYSERIILSSYFKLGPNFKKMLTKEWQIVFFISKFRQRDSSKIAAEHFNYLEIASVIKSGYLIKANVFPLTFTHAVIVFNSFCEAVYFQYLEQTKVRYSSVFSEKMANILLQYYNDCPQNADFLYHDVQYLLNHHAVCLRKTISENVKLLQIKNQPYQDMKATAALSSSREGKVSPFPHFFSSSGHHPAPVLENFSPIKSIKYSSN